MVENTPEQSVIEQCENLRGWVEERYGKAAEEEFAKRIAEIGDDTAIDIFELISDSVKTANADKYARIEAASHEPCSIAGMFLVDPEEEAIIENKNF